TVNVGAFHAGLASNCGLCSAGEFSLSLGLLTRGAACSLGGMLTRGDSALLTRGDSERSLGVTMLTKPLVRLLVSISEQRYKPARRCAMYSPAGSSNPSATAFIR